MSAPHVDIEVVKGRAFITIETRYGTLDLTPADARELIQKVEARLATIDQRIKEPT